MRPRQLAFDDPANLARWEPRVRAHIFDFEIASRLSFTTVAAGSGVQRASAWHLVPGGTSSVPSAAYKPIVDASRPDEDFFKQQLEFVDRYADLRPDRASEILSQVGGGQAFLSSISYLHPDRTPRTLELIDAAFRLAIHVEMRFKHALASRRPLEYSPQIQPMILTPSHGSLPSGHATESFTIALVLWMLLRDSGTAPYRDVLWGEQLMRLASRIAVNRTVAGVHFPVDSAAGCVLGLTLGQYFVNRCTGAANYEAWSFDGSKFPDGTGSDPLLDGDFHWRALYDVDAKPNPKQKSTAAPYDYATSAGTQPLGAASPILAWLWNKAKAEWT